MIKMPSLKWCCRAPSSNLCKTGSGLRARPQSVSSAWRLQPVSALLAGDVNCGTSQKHRGEHEQGSLWGEGSGGRMRGVFRASLRGQCPRASEGQKQARGSVADRTLVPAKALEPVGTAPKHGTAAHWPPGHVPPAGVDRQSGGFVRAPVGWCIEKSFLL